MYRFLIAISIILLFFTPIKLFWSSTPYQEDIYGKNYFEYFYEQQDEIDELRKENQELREKYTEFNNTTEKYVKILSEWREILDEKEWAYNQALNSIKWWFWIISIIFWWIIWLLWFFWLREWGNIRKGISNQVEKIFNEALTQEKNLLIETVRKIEDRMSKIEDWSISEELRSISSNDNNEEYPT